MNTEENGQQVNTEEGQQRHTDAIMSKLNEAGVKIISTDGLLITCVAYKANGQTDKLTINTEMQVRSDSKVNVSFGEATSEYTFFIDGLIKKHLTKQEPVTIPNYTDEEKQMLISEAHGLLASESVEFTVKADKEFVVVCKCHRSDYGAESVTINLLKDTEEKCLYYYNNSKKGTYYTMSLERLIDKHLRPDTPDANAGNLF